MGGAHNLGVVARLDRQPDGQFAFSIVRSVDKTSTGYPTSITRGRDGALYGMTRGGGGSNRGTAFRLTLDGALTTIHSFSEEHG